VEPLRPLFWGQGMLLQPQHFQQQDSYHNALLHRLVVDLLSPFLWGVCSFRLNETALQNFVFEIERGEFLTFEGTLLRVGDLSATTARIAPRKFEQDFDPSGRPLSVYVAIRRLRLDESNVAAANGGGASSDNRRFRVEDAEVSDLLAGGGQAQQLQYLVHEAEILFDVSAERTRDYEVIKVAELLRSPDGKGGICSQQYIPPSVSIKSSQVLEATLKEIRELLTAKGTELSGYTRRQASGAELGARDRYLAMLQAVNRYTPLFHHFLEGGQVQPNVMYALMRQLVGELSSFSSSISALGARGTEKDLPPYQHTDLWPCFSIAAQRIRELLNEMTSAPVGEVVLKYDGEYFTAALDEKFLTGDNRYYLAIRSDLTPAELHKVLQATGKVSSREDMPNLQISALFGLKIEVLQSPPDELPMHAHYSYFAVDRLSPQWKKIQSNRTIAVFSTALPPDTEIRLLAIWGK
jgi:type VI secretion system protein ImpJ